MTMTEQKKAKRPEFYANKAARTKVYRALYGFAEGHDPKSDPALNEKRRMPEGWSYARSRSLFEDLAQRKDDKDQMISNGLFPLRRYEELVQRLDRLRLLDRVQNKA